MRMIDLLVRFDSSFADREADAQRPARHFCQAGRF
jgi:hypothetical protein